MKNIFASFPGWILIGLFAASCAIQPVPVPTIEPSPQAVTRPTLTLTPAPTHFPTITPQPTATPDLRSDDNSFTGTPTQIPTPFSLIPTADSHVPLSSRGPWLAYYVDQGNLAAEFNSLEQFFDWQPDSKAIVFITPGESSNQRTINYYQPADRILKSFLEILPANTTYNDQLIWGDNPSSFFLRVGRTQELDYIDILKNQLLRVDWPIGTVDIQYAWIGVSKTESNSTLMDCYVDQ